MSNHSPPPPGTGAARERRRTSNNLLFVRDSSPSPMAIPLRIPAEANSLLAASTARTGVIPGDTVHDTCQIPEGSFSTRSLRRFSEAVTEACASSSYCAIVASAASTDGGLESAGDSGIQPGTSSSTTYVDDLDDGPNTVRPTQELDTGSAHVHACLTTAADSHGVAPDHGRRRHLILREHSCRRRSWRAVATASFLRSFHSCFHGAFQGDSTLCIHDIPTVFALTDRDVHKRCT